MDDFEYSLHISDQDWDTFFLECEGCNVLSPGLVSREDSGMSDFDEMGSHFHGITRLSASFTEPDPQIDGPPHCEGSPVDNYLSRYGIHSPEQVLSGSEEDLHLQTVNLFFEQLKSITVNEQPSEQSHTEYSGSEKTDHLECLIDKQDLQYVVICPSGMSEANPKGKISKQGEAHTWGRTALEKPIMPTCTNAQVNAPDSSKSEPDFGGEPLSFQLITVGAKQEQEKRCWDPKLKPETKPPDKEKMPPMVRVNGIDMTIPIPTRGAIAQMDIGCRSDSIDSPISPIPISPSNLRRKRRKKKRMFIEAEEMSPEAQIRIHQSESEEERFVQRDEPTNLSANVKKTEQASLSGMKISTVRYNSDHSHQSFSAGSEVPAGLKCSKSLPVSFTTFNGKPQVLQTSLCSISKSMNEMSLENNGLLKAESGTKSILVQIDKVLSKQESNIALNILESNSTIQLRGTDCSPTDTREIKSETLSDHSQTGCQRKYLLSPNISSTADSTGPFSSSVSFNLTEETNKDVSCLGNETDYCAFISEQNLQSRWNTTVIFDALQSSPSLMEKIVESETCSHGGTPKMYSNEMQEEKAGTNVDNLETFKTSMDRPLSGAKSDTECHGTESTVGSDEKVEEYLQNTNNKSEVLMVNALLMKPVGSTGESENNIKTEDDHLHHAAEDTTIGEHLLNEIKTRSSERIHGYDEDIKMHNKDSVENPSANVSQNTFSSPPDSKSESNDPLDTTRLDSPDQIPSPVFAISSFWNEMEKLTINDILGLRRIGNTQNPSVLTHPDDRSVDATDAADSGYFTQPDDSKTEHLSGDMSFISDLDEDIAQIQAQYSLKQDDESCGFPSRSCSVMWENDSDPATMGEDMMYISSETALPDQFFGADVQPCFRKFLKNISVQNLQTLDAQPMREMLRKASLHSIHSEADDPFYHVNTSYPTCFSDDEDVDGDGIRFSEIIEYFFGHDEPEPCAFLADQNATTPFIEDSGTSVPEMYDHFFSEFDSGSFFNPFEMGGNQMVPIFSCTRFANRNLQFPEAYDYFFPDSPVHSDEDDDNEAPTRVVSRYDHTPSNTYSVATTDMYEHFYPEDTFQGNLLWANPFSFRRFQRTDSEGKSWPFHKGIQSTAVIGLEDKPFPDSLYLNLENQIFQQLAEQQKKCMELQTVIADPRLDAPFLPLRQADMCLVCIAFASWVLKSASPGADTWKAALLANISALSAIRYLRRHKRGEASGKTPLLQIEPA